MNKREIIGLFVWFAYSAIIAGCTYWVIVKAVKWLLAALLKH